MQWFEDLNAALPLITFIISLFAASFGMSKFFLSGPIQFLPNNSVFNGILSVPFVSLFLINSMFGFRIICTESAFFTSYRHQHLNQSHSYQFLDLKQITPVISPEYRLLVYLAPCVISFLINGLRLWYTTKVSWKYFMKYPQFFISPCFTPFMFEGGGNCEKNGQPDLMIWKWGTISNAIYIGFIPQCILCYTDYQKGVHNWDFNNFNHEYSFTTDDALFKSNYGNTIFALATATIFLTLIIFFFRSQNIFKERGIHCRCLNILCCPCPEPCIKLGNSSLDSSSSLNSLAQQLPDKNIETHLPSEKLADDNEQPHSEIYLYRRKFVCVEERKFQLLDKLPTNNKNSQFSVTIILIFYTYIVNKMEKLCIRAI